MNTLMPAPVAKPQIGKQAVEARLRAGAHFSSSRVHACESSLAGLPGLYSGLFLFCKQHDHLARYIHSQVNTQRLRLASWHAPASRNPRLHQVRRGKAHHHLQEQWQVWCLPVSGVAVAKTARRGLQQGGDCVRRLFKLLVIRAYLLDLLPARTVVLAFRLFDLKHE